MKILREELIVKKMEASDIKILYNRLNLSYVEKYCQDETIAQWEAHEKWYNFLLNSPYYKMYILTNKKDEFLGNIKFEIDEHKAVLNIFIVPEIRGNNCSYFFIEESLKKLEEEIQIEELEAYILEENIISLHLFEKLGFSFLKNQDYSGVIHKLYIK